MRRLLEEARRIRRVRRGDDLHAVLFREGELGQDVHLSACARDLVRPRLPCRRNRSRGERKLRHLDGTCLVRQVEGHVCFAFGQTAPLIPPRPL